MCAYCNTPHAIGGASWTKALLALLIAFGNERDDAVINTPYTFFATAGCIARTGAKPLFVDIDSETYNISPSAIQEYIEKNCQADPSGELKTRSGERVRAIVPVHLFGLCCEMDPIHQISEHYQLDVIEDAAQAIGAEYPFGERTARAGTMGEAGFFSFYPSKNLGAAGDAGMIVCRDAELAKKLRIFRDHGMDPRYFHSVIGGNFRLDEIQAAILAVKLPHLKSWSAARRGVADFYRADFARSAALCGKFDCGVFRVVRTLGGQISCGAHSARYIKFAPTGRFRSGQTGQTVNLLALRLRWFESSPAQFHYRLGCSRAYLATDFGS